APRRESAIPCRVAAQLNFAGPAAAPISFRASFTELKHQPNSFPQPMPARSFRLQLCPAFARQAVKLGFAAGFGVFPVSRQEAPVFQAVQRRIKRALL